MGRWHSYQQHIEETAPQLMQSALIGLFVGVAVSLFRGLIPRLSALARQVYTWGTASLGQALLVLLGLAGVGALVGLQATREPNIGGSGIPQVMGEIAGKMQPCWYRVLLWKFCGGLLTLGSGLTAGREGPSVQIGASLGVGYFHGKQLLQRLWQQRQERASDGPRRTEEGSAAAASALAVAADAADPRVQSAIHSLVEKNHFLVAGAAAGLAAAFHAPLAGTLFVLEELLHQFTPAATLFALTAAICSDFIASLAFSLAPVLHFPKLPDFPLRAYAFLLLLGVIVGLSGVLFNRLILLGKSLYSSLPLPMWARAVIPFVASGALILLSPELFGSGESFIFLPLQAELPSAGRILLLYLLKFALLLLAFCSGIPGGIFYPLLVLGSLLGSLFGSLGFAWGLLPQEAILLCSVFAMSAHFAAIVRSPVTGILLIIEMSDALPALLPLIVVTLIAYLTATALGSTPIYHALLDRLLEKD